ncbi:hypothetical protein [uncultured Actinomyces sp.]|uniref:hypothetical protein n=1 Tax=uncultured Actinomyces sp. TaxID=249061 RepID=UPI0028E83A07|nr:hypothetical protein [uncultured Actinomyces sp.]
MQTIYTPAELAEVIELTEEPTRFTTLDEARDMVREVVGCDADTDIEALVDEWFAWYQALDMGSETVTLNRQGFYQVVTVADFWKAVERLGL